LRGTILVFDATSLFLGSAFALFLALLAWGDQIRKPKKEITELEDQFRKAFGVEKKIFNPLFRKTYDETKPSQKYSFLEQTKAMIGVLENKKLKGSNAALLNRFKELHDVRKDLEKKYTFRYLFTIWFCVGLFIFGLASIFTNEVMIKIYSANIQIVSIAMFICSLICITVIIINLLRTHNKENEFVTKLYAVEDAIED
jgi:type IV secretory pathway TraG/TraD family ATPase VirD4